VKKLKGGWKKRDTKRYNEMMEYWPQGLQIGFPNSMVSLFQPWGQYTAIKFSIY
jgi:hypothetical protein